MTKDRALVVDGVCHAYDWREENQQNEYAAEFARGMYDPASEIYSADGWEMPEEKFFKRQTADDLAGVLVAITWQLPFLLYVLSFVVAAMIFLWFREPRTEHMSGGPQDERCLRSP